MDRLLNSQLQNQQKEIHMVSNTTGWEDKADIVAKDGIAAVGKLNTALMKAEKAQFSLEEKHKKASNNVAKKVK